MQDQPTYSCEICEEPSTLSCSHKAQLVCKLCRAPAHRTEEGIFRHVSKDPWADGSGFCDKYGYPIPAYVPRKKS